MIPSSNPTSTQLQIIMGGMTTGTCNSVNAQHIIQHNQTSTTSRHFEEAGILLLEMPILFLFMFGCDTRWVPIFYHLGIMVKKFKVKSVLSFILNNNPALGL
jgi:hypothetical protein